MPPTMAAQFAGGFHVLFLYDWNEVLLRSVWQKGIGPALAPGVTKPDRYFTFQPVDGSPLPRYRFPPSVTLPSGITLNEFGCRGRDLAVDKPPRTIRIACVGASTTVDDHRSAHSYPELLEGFLSAWAEAHHPGLRVEVLNAGCDGYLSSETVWNVRHVVLPLAVDYVVYYEGANQLQSPQILRHLQIDGEVPPAPRPDGLFDATAAAKGERQWLYEHSAMLRRLHTVLVRGDARGKPPKPPQRLQWPAGLDGAVDLARQGEVLGLGDVFRDLATIRQEVTAAGATLVLCSFQWFVHEGLRVDPITGQQIWSHLNVAYWPISYASLRNVADVQNRWFAAWAAANSVDFVDVAATMPEQESLYTDPIHKTQLGSRCHAWAAAVGLVPLLERDLAAGKVPVADRRADAQHPGLGTRRMLTAAELDAGR